MSSVTNWIKMRAALQDHPKVVRIMSALNADILLQDVHIRSDQLRVIGALHAVWCVFDMYSTDGKLVGYTPEFLDSKIRLPGFSKALASVDWLTITPQGLELPEFDEHNSKSAKRRADDAKRKDAVRKLSAADADKTRSERKRKSSFSKEKEEAPAKRVAKKPKTAMPDGFGVSDAVRKWSEKNGFDKLEQHLEAFIGKVEANGYVYADWDAAFKNCIREDWGKVRVGGSNGKNGGGDGWMTSDAGIERKAKEIGFKIPPGMSYRDAKEHIIARLDRPTGKPH